MRKKSRAARQRESGEEALSLARIHVNFDREYEQMFGHPAKGAAERLAELARLDSLCHRKEAP